MTKSRAAKPFILILDMVLSWSVESYLPHLEKQQYLHYFLIIKKIKYHNSFIDDTLSLVTITAD